MPSSMLKDHGQLTVSVTQLLSSLTHYPLGAQTEVISESFSLISLSGHHLFSTSGVANVQMLHPSLKLNTKP